MSSPISVDVPHRLGAEEARRRIEGGVGSLKNFIPGAADVRSAWTGDRLGLQIAMMGQEVSAQIDVARWKTEDEQAALRLRQRVLARVLEIRGVETAALATELPAVQFATDVPFDIGGRAVADQRDRPTAGLTVVTADYFKVVGVPLTRQDARVFQDGTFVRTRAPVGFYLSFDQYF